MHNVIIRTSIFFGVRIRAVRVIIHSHSTIIVYLIILSYYHIIISYNIFVCAAMCNININIDIYHTYIYNILMFYIIYNI